MKRYSIYLFLKTTEVNFYVITFLGKTIKKSAGKEKSAEKDLKKKSIEKEPVSYYIPIKPAFRK